MKPAENENRSDPRVHLANERTLLAWIRTSVALMAFGFVVVKFSLFLKQLTVLSGGKIVVTQHGLSSVLGITMVTIGAITIPLASIRYLRTERQLLSQKFQPSSGLLMSLVFILVITSLLLILYLINNASEVLRIEGN